MMLTLWLFSLFQVATMALLDPIFIIWGFLSSIGLTNIVLYEIFIHGNDWLWDLFTGDGKKDTDSLPGDLPSSGGNN